jgi:hypothetical protein
LFTKESRSEVVRSEGRELRTTFEVPIVWGCSSERPPRCLKVETGCDKPVEEGKTPFKGAIDDKKRRKE